ncbi:MAG: putative drug exporter of the superfamily [Actinomycetota bacterium]|jgi:RND superfamily putative drug exporter|nr:putative drug exporter of the superfamily [Actinomycetota bacterium]MDQ1541051.1 putative drug exporter of the superfamily [Actinomycetota bacterium]
MAALARWCFRHRFIVVGSWLGLLIGLILTTSSIGTRYSSAFTLPGTESSKALALVRDNFHGQAGDVDTIVVHTSTGSVTDPAVQSKVTALLSTVAALPGVGAVKSPYTPQGAAQVSADQRTAFASVVFAQQAQSIDKSVLRQMVSDGAKLRSSTLDVEFGGNAIQQLNGSPTSTSELIGLVAAAIVLLLAFGSLLSMAIPLLAAIFALGAAILSIGLISHLINVASIAPTIAALVGLGVGIDYALFIVTRYRNGLKAGLPPEEAAVTALNTSGRAVLFAGATVAVAMLGLLILRLSFLNGIGIAAGVMVAFAVSAAVTLLPAIFGLFGARVLTRRERRKLRDHGASDVNATGPWARWAGYVQRKPAVLAAVSGLLMVVLALPFLSLRLGSSDQGNDPRTSTTRHAYDLLATGFGPGYNGPLQLVAQVPTAADQAALDALVAQLRTEPGVASVAAASAKSSTNVETVQVVPSTSPQSAQTAKLIDRLRHTVIPAAERGTSLQVYVGGQTAIFKDFAGVLTGKLPLFIVVIVALGCLLLMVAFRSVVIPLTAAVMNLLSAGAAFGVVVAVFQWGWGSEAIGHGKPGPVEAFLPVMMLAILFGLSMDYQVFLVSRMHEEWVHTGDNKRAVRVGQAATGRVITAAAVIMVCVFVAFVFGGERDIAEFGLGLAVAILLDALVLRTVLVPAAMQMFGRANWWLPAWLDRILPQLSVEPADAADSSVDIDEELEPAR